MFEALGYSTVGTLLFLALSALAAAALVFVIVSFAAKKADRIKRLSLTLFGAFLAASIITLIILNAVYRDAQQRTIDSFLARQEESMNEDNAAIYGED